MGWKNIKEHYKIDHIVSVSDKYIYIGSQYVLGIIKIDTKYKTCKWGGSWSSSNSKLDRYYSEMNSDLNKLFELYDMPDTFEKSLPVYTYDGSDIIEEVCEVYGWPNVTHAGHVMWENTYSSSKKEVISWAKKNAKLGITLKEDKISELKNELSKYVERLNKEKKILAKLNKDYP